MHVWVHAPQPCSTGQASDSGAGRHIPGGVGAYLERLGSFIHLQQPQTDTGAG